MFPTPKEMTFPTITVTKSIFKALYVDLLPLLTLLILACSVDREDSNEYRFGLLFCQVLGLI